MYGDTSCVGRPAKRNRRRGWGLIPTLCVGIASPVADAIG